MSEIADLLERFRRGGELIAVVTTGVAGAETDYTPEPGKWSIRQIVCHMSDSEIVGADRFRRVIAEDNPTIMWYDEKAWAEKLDYRARKLSQGLETFRRIRGENYELLKNLPEEQYARTGVHSRTGTVTLLDLLRTYATHAESHARQIQEARVAFKSRPEAEAR
ncbi:MAG: DinB family protein [Acidobacteria bacterium]|nr:DinB family protein [Acidobacteriota bacterium]